MSYQQEETGEETGKERACQPALEVPDKKQSKRIRELAGRGKTKVPGRAGLSGINFAAIDLETTGFYPSRGDEIIFVGAVLIQGGKIQSKQSFHRLVNPCRNIPETIVRLTGISQSQVSEANSIYEVLPDFLSFVGENVLIGHTVQFDLGFLNCKLKPCRTKIYNKSLDIADLARAILPSLPDYSLDGLLAHFGIEKEGRHTALGDALLTAKIFLTLLDLGFEKNIACWGDLDHCLKIRRWFRRKPYGLF
ncbi:3'-5' exonuclease [Desulfoscipio gibsoniae]|uniref:Exonuclease, DNA polymerase III, epsilon subunit family n=1 Tax=Desulfoscipio gibsoniae DSM 7213 TaxID=767817 RepID=R4KGG6_9FIRM|nr:exonuclease domain-containing protein [Desulfoscipio gibsoniae]AGL02308.1 exonuclease, DNA polymerase III, epsilon subunit family [Desulfoscipio gibsoniae DSM 7213]